MNIDIIKETFKWIWENLLYIIAAIVGGAFIFLIALILFVLFFIEAPIIGILLVIIFSAIFGVKYHQIKRERK